MCKTEARATGSVCAVRKANGGIISQQDLLAVVNDFLLQIVASGDN